MPLLPNIDYVSIDARVTTVVLRREDGASIYLHKRHATPGTQEIATFLHGCHLTSNYPAAF